MTGIIRSAVSLGLLAGVSLAAMNARAADSLGPVVQQDLTGLVAAGRTAMAFDQAFEKGDALTEFDFTSPQGVGANIGGGQRFSRIPRADLDGPGEWATHFPAREGGANATSCISCHDTPVANGAGRAAVNIVLDPDHTGDPSQYLIRNTTHLFALSIPQRLAEEMSLDLRGQREAALADACATGAATALSISQQALTISARTNALSALSRTRVHARNIGLDLFVASVAPVSGIVHDPADRIASTDMNALYEHGYERGAGSALWSTR